MANIEQNGLNATLSFTVENTDTIKEELSSAVKEALSDTEITSTIEIDTVVSEDSLNQLTKQLENLFNDVSESVDATIRSSLEDIQQIANAMKESTESTLSAVNGLRETISATIDATYENNNSFKNTVEKLTTPPKEPKKDDTINPISKSEVDLIIKSISDSKKLLETLNEEYIKSAKADGTYAQLLKDYNTQVKKALDDGRISTEGYQKLLAGATDKIDEVIVQMNKDKIDADFRSQMDAISKSIESIQGNVKEIQSSNTGDVKTTGGTEDVVDELQSFKAMVGESIKKIQDKEESDKRKGDDSKNDPTNAVKNALNDVPFFKECIDNLGYLSEGITTLRETASQKTDNIVERRDAMNKSINTLIGMGFNSLKNITSFGVGLIKNFWDMLLRASPMLSSIMNLFSGIFSLILMPLGNKIGELLIPAVLDLYDSLEEMWYTIDEAWNNGGLGGMIEVAVQFMVESLIDIIGDFGNMLINSNSDWLSNLGVLLKIISNLMSTTLMPAVTMLLNVTTYVLSHIKIIASLIVGSFAALKVYQMAYNAQVKATLNLTKNAVTTGFRGTNKQLLSMNKTIWAGFKSLRTMVAAKDLKEGARSAIETETTLAGMAASSISPGAMVAAGLGMAAATLLSSMVLSDIGLKSGGYVPATEGGELHILAEGGEGEFVIPESKAEKFAEDYGKNISNNRNNSYTIQINGYTDSELKTYITDLMDEKASISRIRAGI